MTTAHREGALVLQCTDFADHIVVSRMLQGDKGGKVLVPQWQRVVSAIHKQIASAAVTRYLQPDNSSVPEKPVCMYML